MINYTHIHVLFTVPVVIPVNVILVKAVISIGYKPRSRLINSIATETKVNNRLTMKHKKFPEDVISRFLSLLFWNLIATSHGIIMVTFSYSNFICGQR